MFRSNKEQLRAGRTANFQSQASQKRLLNGSMELGDPFSGLSTDWERSAIDYFFANYVIPPAPEVVGHLHFLPEAFTRYSDCECLRNSLLAVAISSLANVSCITTLEHKAAQLYGKALRSISSAVRLGPRDEGNDLVMLSIFLIQNYDVCQDQSGSSTRPHKHVDHKWHPQDTRSARARSVDITRQAEPFERLQSELIRQRSLPNNFNSNSNW